MHIRIYTASSEGKLEARDSTMSIASQDSAGSGDRGDSLNVRTMVCGSTGENDSIICAFASSSGSRKVLSIASARMRCGLSMSGAAIPLAMATPGEVHKESI